MKNSYFLLLICFVVLSAVNSCKKDPTKNATLPPATQEGKNTVGFTVNGEVWVPYYKCGFGQNPCGEISAKIQHSFSCIECNIIPICKDQK